MSTTPIMYWVAGWATDLSLWQEEISSAFPTYKHTFLKYHDTIPQGTHQDIFIGWSLGAYFLNINEVSGKRILVNPALHFCHPTFGWKERILERMQKQLEQHPQAVLENFAQNMNCPDPQKWVTNALSQDRSQQVKGLGTLKNTEACPCVQATVIVGSQDQICPLPLQQSLFTNFVQVENAGHWPLHTDILTAIQKEL